MQAARPRLRRAWVKDGGRNTDRRGAAGTMAGMDMFKDSSRRQWGRRPRTTGAGGRAVCASGLESRLNRPFTVHSHRGTYDPAVLVRLMPSSLLLLLLLLGLAAPSPASEHDAVRREVQAGRLQPLSEILRGVQQRHGGRVIDVELERGTDGRRWYEIKLVDARQQRREIYVDAVTGREIAKPGAITTQVLPLADVVAATLRQHPGAVLKVELETMPGEPPYYEFQLLTREGRELLLRVDAQTGAARTAPPIDATLAGRLLPLPPILLAMERRHGGRATEAELKRGQDGRSYYEIELLLTGGQSIEVHVDATTGQLLGEDELR